MKSGPASSQGGSHCHPANSPCGCLLSVKKHHKGAKCITSVTSGNVLITFKKYRDSTSMPREYDVHQKADSC